MSIVKKRAVKPTFNGVNIILPVFPTFFHPIWVTFGTGDVHKRQLLFRENRRYGTPYFTWRRRRIPIRAFHLYCPICMKFGTRSEHSAADHWSVSRESERGRPHFLHGRKSNYVYPNTVRHSDSKNALV
jgi:hypothetical protein